MDKKETIKKLLENFQENVDISIFFTKEEAKIKSIFVTDCKKFNIISKTWEEKGYLSNKIYLHCCTFERHIAVTCDFSLAKIHDIGVIEEEIYNNTKKALETFLEEV